MPRDTTNYGMLASEIKEAADRLEEVELDLDGYLENGTTTVFERVQAGRVRDAARTAFRVAEDALETVAKYNTEKEV